MRLEKLEAEFARLQTLTGKVIPSKTVLQTGTLVASNIELRSPDGQTQRVSMCGHETGAWITLFDGKGRSRLILSVDDGAPADDDYPAQPSDYSLCFYGLDGDGERQLGLQLGLRENNGALEVYTSGSRPAALIKGIGEGGGVVGVTDEEGTVCGLLRREDEGGKLELFRPSLKRSVMLHAMPDGGALSLGAAGAPASAILVGKARGAALLLNDDEDRDCRSVRLMADDTLAIVAAHDNASSHSASMTAAAGHAFLEVERGDKDDKTQVFGVTSVENSNCLQLKRPDGSSALTMQATSTDASLSGTDAGDNQRFMLSAGDQINGLTLIGANGVNESLSLQAEERAQLVMNSAGQPVVVLDTEDDCGRVTVLEPAQSNRQVAMRAMPESAGLSISKVGGETAAQLWADDEGGRFQLCHRDGTQRVHMHSHATGGGVMVCGETGSGRAAMGVGEDRGQVVVQAAGGDPMALLHGDEDGGQLTLFNDYGERALTLPDDATLL